jgi:hypothetical protein
VPQRQQAGPGSLQHGHALAPQLAGDLRIDRAAQVAQDRDWLAGLPGHIEQRERVGVVAVQLVHQVDRERHRSHRRIARERRQGTREQLAGIGACPPHVQRVLGDQARVKQGRQPRRGGAADRGERHAELVGQVDHMRPLKPGVVHGRDPGRLRATPVRPPARGEQLHGVRELGQVPDPVHAVRAGQCLPAAVGSGQRA